MAGVYKRGKIYWGRAQRNGVERRISLKTEDRRVADKRFRQWLDNLDAIAWGDKPRYSFEQAVLRFMREHVSTLKPSSARRYATSLKQLAESMVDKTLDEITTGALSEFETLRRSQGVRPPTVRRDLACLSSMLTSCVEWEWIDTNPVPAYLKRRSKRGLKEAPPRTRYFTTEEEESIINSATYHVRRAIILAVETGLRREELFSLTWDQIDAARGLIRTTTKTKSGRVRYVPLSDRARTNIGTPSKGYVLCHEDGKRYVQMEKGFKAACRRAGVRDARWHDLRRTAGCRWLQRDRRSMEEVSVLLGHSSVVVTEKIYAFLEAEDVAMRKADG